MKHYKDENWEKILLPEGNTLINLSTGEEEQMQKIAKCINWELKDFNERERTFTAVASTGTKDRDGDVMRASGAILKNFRKNPVVLFGHDDSALPIAKATDIRVENEKLLFKPKFASAEMNPFADQVFKMFKGGFLRAFSIRFDPIEFDMIPNDPKSKDQFVRQGREFKKWELLEISAVNIPANPEALKSAEYQEFAMKSFIKSHGGNDDDIQLHTTTVEKVKEEPEEIKKEEKQEIKIKKEWEENTPQELLDDATRRLEEKKDKLEDLKIRQDMSNQEKELDAEIKKLEDEIAEQEKMDEVQNKLNDIQSGITSLCNNKKGEQNG